MRAERSDAELWQLAPAGEHAAFGVLFERHARTVYTYCFRRTADWSQAEDLTSLVFLEAWRRRAEVTLIHASVLPWLLGVATNVVRNAWRARVAVTALLSRVSRATTAPTISQATSTGASTTRREMRALLRAVAEASAA